MQNTIASIHWVGLPPLPDGTNGTDQPSPSSVNFDETYKPRLLACKQCGWILGIVMRQKTETRAVRRLWVLVEAIDDECHVPSVAVLRSSRRGLYRVHGLDQSEIGIECSHCGGLTPWSMSMESYLRMISHYGSAD